MLTQVLAARDGDHLGRHRRHEHDRGGERRVRCLLRGHLPRDGLGQEVRPLQIDSHELFEALFRRFEDVGANSRRAAGIVHERVNRVVPSGNRVGEPRAVGLTADVRLEVLGAAVERGQQLGDISRRTDAAQGQPPTFGGERTGNAQTDPASAAGDEPDPLLPRVNCQRSALHRSRQTVRRVCQLPKNVR